YTPNGKYILNPNAQSLQGFSPNYRGHTGTPEDGTAQILFTSRYGDWYNREWAPSEYRMDYEEYKHSTQSPEILARVWLWCYEYPADIESQYTIRSNSAKYFYELFKGEPPTPPEPQPTPPYIRKSRFKIMYYLKNHKII
ncbi:MAG: hypothetical protein KBT46_05585, partial [Ruminococcus sp.]|nr:hypothetical protein [Candidatus Copronaster equi]